MKEQQQQFTDEQRQIMKRTIDRLREIAPNNPVMNQMMDDLQGPNGLPFFDQIVNAIFDIQGGELRVREGKPFEHEIADYIVAQCDYLNSEFLRYKLKKQGIVFDN